MCRDESDLVTSYTELGKNGQKLMWMHNLKLSFEFKWPKLVCRWFFENLNV